MLPVAGVLRRGAGSLHRHPGYIRVDLTLCYLWPVSSGHPGYTGVDLTLCYLWQVSYVVVLVPYIAILVLLVRGVSMSGSSDGIRFYTTPRWELLRQPRMWGDAAAQVFFSLSVCWGGLTTLASYNKFHNNIYR